MWIFPHILSCVPCKLAVHVHLHTYYTPPRNPFWFISWNIPMLQAISFVLHRHKHPMGKLGHLEYLFMFVLCKRDSKAGKVLGPQKFHKFFLSFNKIKHFKLGIEIKDPIKMHPNSVTVKEKVFGITLLKRIRMNNKEKYGWKTLISR